MKTHVRSLAVLGLAAALPAQTGIRIVMAPSPLALPAPGATLLLEVEIAGDAAPDDVWIAADATAVDRVAMTAAGGSHYQRNLADAAVAALLPAGRDGGSLFVFARRGNRTDQSAAIGWVRATNAQQPVRCVVRTRGAATRNAAPDHPTWLDVDGFERIELQGATARQSTAVARLADFEVPLVRRADDGLWLLDADPRLRERLHEVQSFEIEVKQGTASSLFPFRCIPNAVRAAPRRETFTVPQRRRAFVPGTGEWLEVRIDDITMGQVHLDLVTAEGASIATARSVRERDRVEFALGKNRYLLVVKRLDNSLVGEDHAEFAIEDVATAKPDRIGQLIRAVEDSEDTFLRDGKEYGGKLAAQFLLGKVRSLAAEPSVDEFVDVVASKSSRTGEAYRVRRKDGSEITMREWLAAEQRKLERADRR